MAFVHDIEADKIDDFNLFQAFVRVPLLILGGVLGGKSDESSSIDEEDVMCAGAGPSLNKDLNDGDDDAMDCCSSSSSTRVDSSSAASCTNKSTPQSPKNRIVSDTDIDETDSDADDGLKRSKKMSWSDSAGLRLVEYNDESQQHEPLNAPLQPTKSAMKKQCQSERDPTTKSTDAAPKRYIPKMGGAAISMPSFSHNGGSSPGYVSPEWGWYINTTPPTPEMYHSHSTCASSIKLSRTDATGAPVFPLSSQNSTFSCANKLQDTNGSSRSNSKPHHNHVFQNLQSNMTQNMGWTSVPI